MEKLATKRLNAKENLGLLGNGVDYKSNSHEEKYCRKLKQQTYTNQSNHYEISNGNDEDDHSFAFKASDVFSENDQLLVDSGATSHICNDLTKFVSFDEEFESERHFIELADGTVSNNMGTLRRGTVEVKIKSSEGKSYTTKLEDTLYVPSYPQNIFSVRAATKNGCIATFGPKSAELVMPDQTKFPLVDRNRLYYLYSNVDKMRASHDLKKWHELLGHCNIEDIKKMESIVNGMVISKKENFDCETCILGKQTQTISRVPDKRATKPLELVHIDLAGPIKPIGQNGFHYAIIFVDDFSGLVFVYFLKQKSDAVSATKRFLVDSSPYGKVERLRSDNGGEFICSDFQDLLLENKIRHEKSAPNSPHQNGTAERGWRTLFEMARCLLIRSSMPKEMWKYAVAMAAYIRNRCYIQRTK